MEHDYRIENCLVYGYSDKEKNAPGRCTCCKRGIYEGEDYFDFMGEIVCDECEYEYVLKNFHRYL